MISLPEEYTDNVSFIYTGLPKVDRSGSRAIPEQQAVAGDRGIIPTAQEYDEGSRDFAYRDMGTEEQLFNTSRPFTPLHYYELDGAVGGVTTFRIEADVDTSAFPADQAPADFYIPVRVENTWKCSSEVAGAGSYEEGCQSLLDYRATSSTGLYDPVNEDGSPYITSSDFDLHGLYGDQRCSVTHETGDPFRIGTDTDAGPGSFNYVRTFALHANPSVHYIGPNDDLCDRHVAPIRFADSDDPDDSDDENSGSLNGGSLGSLGSTGNDDDDDPATSGSLGSLGNFGSTGNGDDEQDPATSGSLGSLGADGTTGSLTLTPQCVLTGSAIILPLLALGPIAQAAPHIPGIAEAQAQIDQFLSQSHTDIQKRLGIYNEDTARRVAEINAQLAQIGVDLQGPATAIGGTALALLAVGALANNCVA